MSLIILRVRLQFVSHEGCLLWLRRDRMARDMPWMLTGPEAQKLMANYQGDGWWLGWTVAGRGSAQAMNLPSWQKPV